MVGNRNQRHVREFREQRLIIGEVHPAVHGRHGGGSQTAYEGKVEVVPMKVENIEIAGALTDFLELQDAVRQGVVDVRQSEGLRRAGDELRGGLGVAARE